MTNRSFYDNEFTARDYLHHPVTAGEARMCRWIAAREGPVLDIGCGAGRIHTDLAAVSGATVGVDYAMKPLHLYRSQYPRARLVGGAASALPFADGKFGVVLFGYHMIESLVPEKLRNDALFEAARVLTGRGHMILTRHTRMGYKPRSQLLGYLTGRAAEFGDLHGRSRISTGANTEYFGMHVSSRREFHTSARRAGFDFLEAWDFDTAAPPRARSRAVVECFTTS